MGWLYPRESWKVCLRCQVISCKSSLYNVTIRLKNLTKALRIKRKTSMKCIFACLQQMFCYSQLGWVACTSALCTYVFWTAHKLACPHCFANYSPSFWVLLISTSCTGCVNKNLTLFKNACWTKSKVEKWSSLPILRLQLSLDQTKFQNLNVLKWIISSKPIFKIFLLLKFWMKGFCWRTLYILFAITS